MSEETKNAISTMAVAIKHEIESAIKSNENALADLKADDKNDWYYGAICALQPIVNFIDKLLEEML